MNQIKKIPKGIFNLLKSYFILFIYTCLLYLRKVFRLSKRFIKRIKETWYIGAVLLILLTLLNYIGDYFKISQYTSKYIPGLVNTILAIYLIDFLRIEYERRRDVNRHYLFNLELNQLSIDINLALSIFFETTNYKVDEEELKDIVNRKGFWEEELYNFGYFSLVEKDKPINRNDFLYKILKIIAIKNKHFISSYTSFCSYKEYKLIHNLFSITEEYLYIDYYDFSSESDHSLFYLFKNLFEYEETAKFIYDYNWFRDSDINNTLNRQRGIRKRTIKQGLKLLKKAE
ncbi:hypothetical protein [Peribacillus frigoritolerans]|uniref:hypothetical protein n=1 Tax=Peribacillus frigoritolerans TaxID=450367 RepID=UPI00315DDEEA